MFLWIASKSLSITNEIKKRQRLPAVRLHVRQGMRQYPAHLAIEVAALSLWTNFRLSLGLNAVPHVIQGTRSDPKCLSNSARRQTAVPL
jgi:hypothetical protein